MVVAVAVIDTADAVADAVPMSNERMIERMSAFFYGLNVRVYKGGLTPSSAAPERSVGYQQRSCWRQLQRNVRLGREVEEG